MPMTSHSQLAKLYAMLLGLLIIPASICAQSKKNTLLTIGEHRISADEFAYLYEKNYESNDSVYTEEHLNDYLQLYIKFKLKVAAAYDRGYDTTKAFVGELAGYQKQLARPYLSDPSITEGIIQEAYDRLNKEVAAAHILIRVQNWNSPADTLEAYKKVLELKGQLDEGASFEKLAMEKSEDPSARANQGYLGYFTSMQMVYPFETAAYNAKVGEVAGPVKTRFGYHLILVKDRIPARGACKASHIMIRATAGLSKEDSTAAAEKAQSIYQQLQAGSDWDNLCRQFSDDNNTKNKGGELPWFTTGQMVPSFAEAAFGLKEKGDVSEPVLSPYGWHIIRLEGKKGIEPLDSLKAKIKQRISRDSRSELSQKLFVDKLKKENGFEESASAVQEAIAVFDSTLTEGKWTMPQDTDLSATLFKVGEQAYTQRGFYQYAAAQQRNNSRVTANAYAKSLYEQFVAKSILDYEEEHLGEKYPEYRHLLNEYKEGIMLFNIMTEEVWEKAMEDSVGLKAYFEQHRDQYQWKKRVKATVGSLEDEAMLPKLQADLQSETFEAQPNIAPLNFPKGKVGLSPQHIQAVDRASVALRRNPEYSVAVTAYYLASEGNENAQRRVGEIQRRWSKYNFDEGRVEVAYVEVKEDEDEQAQAIFLQLLTTEAKALENQYNTDSPLALEIKEGWFEEGDMALLDSNPWEVGEYTAAENGRAVFVKIDETAEPGPKSFEECRGPLISDYQAHLEEQWIEELRAKYPVKVNKKLVKKLLKNRGGLK